MDAPSCTCGGVLAMHAIAIDVDMRLQSMESGIQAILKHLTTASPTKDNPQVMTVPLSTPPVPQRSFACPFAEGGCTWSHNKCSASSAIVHMHHCQFFQVRLSLIALLTLNPKPSLSVQEADPSTNRHIVIINAMRRFPKHPRMKDLSSCCWCGVRFGSELSRDQRTKHRNDCVKVIMRRISSPGTHIAATQLLDEIWSDLRVPATDKRGLQPESPDKRHCSSECFGFVGSPPREYIDFDSSNTSSPNSNFNALFESFDSNESDPYTLATYLSDD
jgi:hypothetical protein